MKGVFLEKKEVMMSLAAVILVCFLLFGFGYFLGREEQIIINKSLLQEIPDVNCGSTDISI